MPRQIKPKRYLVEYEHPDEDGIITFEVRVLAADILKAEEVSASYAITSANPIALTLMWVWAACVREERLGSGKTSWPEFRKRILDWEKVGEDSPVDPTQPAEATTSPSTSPSESEGLTSTGGSKPSETTPDS